MRKDAQKTRALALATERGTLTSREATRYGIHRQVLTRLVREGALEPVARGQYRLPHAPITEHHGLALVAATAPEGVVCLLSALAFHGIGTQVPSQVWLALDRRARKPALAWPPLRVVRFGGTSLTEGVEVHDVEGVQVKVYEPAKTVADLFKYRNKVGLDVALEALKEAWQEQRLDMNRLHRFAKICRVDRVMRPYLEAVLA
jgi:predicted transcriptional regulator of viral defense system